MSNQPHKAYLIDPEKRSVTEVMVQDHNCINRHIGSEIFCIGTYLPDGDAVFVDDEGLLYEERTQYFFRLDDRKLELSNTQMLAGKAVVLGSNPMTGDSEDVHISMEKLFEAVRWIGAGRCSCEMTGIKVILHDDGAGEEQL